MPEQALSADEIVRTALALLDDVGLRGFTMRALAQRLRTYPATIYWHVGSRAHVLSAASTLVLDEVTTALPNPSSTPWDEWLIELARRYRRAMQAHPALATWGVTHFEPRVTEAELVEQILSVLTRAGFRGADLVGAYNAFIGSVIGWVGLELIADDPELGFDPEELEASLRELSVDDYPTVVGNLDQLADRAIAFRWHGGITNPLDDAFEFALTTWIEGLRAALRADA